jgi:hypothetical protein
VDVAEEKYQEEISEAGRLIRSWTAAVFVACSGSLSLLLSGCGTLGFDDVSLRCGPISVPAAAPIAKDSSSNLETFLLRGLENTYSLGLDEVGDLLHAAGLQAQIVEWPYWQEAGDDILAATNQRGNLSNLVLVGHSFGADDAVRLAKYLAEKAMDVKLIILLDATAPPPIPANVERVIHYYIPTFFGDNWPDTFAGNVVVPEPGNTRTVIENRYARILVDQDVQLCINHFNIDAVGPMQQIVVSDIASLANSFENSTLP